MKTNKLNEELDNILEAQKQDFTIRLKNVNTNAIFDVVYNANNKKEAEKLALFNAPGCKLSKASLTK